LDGEFATDGPCLSHGGNIHISRSKSRRRRFLPGLKAGVSAPRFL
jgi:hypothetical protein